MSRSVADEAADYLKAAARTRLWPSSACRKCRRRHPGPHRCPAPPRHRFLIAAVWTCLIAASVLVWFVPPSARMIVNLAIWTVNLAAWAATGWRALGRRRRRGH